jgi:RND family efflux transporter MFP subunit
MKKITIYAMMMLVTVILASCGNSKTSNSEKPKTEEAEGKEDEASEADPAPNLSETDNIVRMTGKLALDPQNRADISPIAGGVVRRITVREGIHVKRGQVVAYIENTEVVSLQRQYLTAVGERSAARIELNRQRTLTSQGAGVQKTLQQAESNYFIAGAQVQGIARQLSQLGVSPSSSHSLTTLIPIRSPISGIVGKIIVSMGSYVDMSTLLMTVVNNANLHCDMKVFEKDLPKLHVGQNVSVSLTNAPQVKFRAKIYDINSTFDDGSKSVTVHARITEHPTSRLLPDMFVTGTIE